jgi:hypothetical protein
LSFRALGFPPLSARRSSAGMTSDLYRSTREECIKGHVHGIRSLRCCAVLRSRGGEQWAPLAILDPTNELQMCISCRAHAPWALVTAFMKASQSRSRNRAPCGLYNIGPKGLACLNPSS